MSKSIHKINPNHCFYQDFFASPSFCQQREGLNLDSQYHSMVEVSPFGSESKKKFIVKIRLLTEFCQQREGLNLDSQHHIHHQIGREN